MTPRTLFLFLSVLATATADLLVTLPSPGETIPGESLTVSFTDSGSGTPLKAFESCQIMLCAGGNSPETYLPLLELANVNPATQSDRQLPYAFSPELGANLPNAYFIKFYCAGAAGTATFFSDRFSIATMHGVLPTLIVQAMDNVTGKEGPETINTISGTSPSEPSETASTTNNDAPSQTAATPAETQVSSSPASTPSPTADTDNQNASPSHKKVTLTPGAITGIVIGGVLLVGALGFIAFCIRRRRSRYLPYDPYGFHEYQQHKLRQSRNNNRATFTSFQQYRDKLRSEGYGDNLPQVAHQYQPTKKSRSNHYSSSLSSLLGISKQDSFRDKQSSTNRSSEVSLSSIFSVNVPSKSPTPSSRTTKVYGAKFPLPMDIKEPGMVIYDNGTNNLHPMRYSGHSGRVHSSKRSDYGDD